MNKIKNIEIYKQVMLPLQMYYLIRNTLFFISLNTYNSFRSSIIHELNMYSDFIFNYSGIILKNRGYEELEYISFSALIENKAIDVSRLSIHEVKLLLIKAKNECIINE